MKTFISQNELGRRLGMAPATLKSRMAERGVEMDGVVVNGQKTPVFVFDAEKLPQLRQTLIPVDANTQ